jgi:hypothetical protein
MDSARFRAQYCNQWVKTLGGLIDPAVWERLADPDAVREAFTDDPPAHVAVEVDLSGTAHTVAEAVQAADGRIAVRVGHHSGYDEIDALLSGWHASRRIARLLVTPPYEKRLDPKLSFELVGRREAPAATRALVELLSTGRLVHANDAVLTLHALRAKAIQGEGGQMLSTVKSAGTVHAARAAMFAANSALAAPVKTARPRVRFRTG